VRPNRIAIWTRAAPDIGGGHALRCLTLAHELARGGAEIIFVCDADTIAIVPALARCQFLWFDVGSAEATTPLAAIAAHWADGADACIVDDYAIAGDQERELRGSAPVTMVIDDLANRRHDCDLLLDQNLGRASADYAGLVPAHAQLLCGPRFALLRPEFGAARSEALQRRQTTTSAERVLISFGLTDAGGLTLKVAQALCTGAQALQFDVVIGASAASRPALERLALRQSHVTVHVDPQDLAGLMVRADIAVGAAGTTSWERCCLGLPSLVTIVADNQRGSAQALAAAGAAEILQPAAGLEEAIVAGVLRLSARASERRQMAQRASAIADGRGVSRVARALSSAIAITAKRGARDDGG
jgi:UDP-2,4-diacetamido-2,4,6-trideoxy-beta-L-altropyranose hydrolase